MIKLINGMLHNYTKSVKRGSKNGQTKGVKNDNNN